MTFWIGLDLPYRFFHKKQYSTFDCMRKYGIVHSKLCHSEREREREMSALPVAHISGGQSFECHWKKTSLLACSTFSYWRGAGGTLYLIIVLYCVGSVLVDDSDIVEVEGAELYFWVLSSKLYWYISWAVCSILQKLFQFDSWRPPVCTCHQIEDVYMVVLVHFWL